MAHRLRLNTGTSFYTPLRASHARAFMLVGCALAFGAVLVRHIPARLLEWQPELAFSQPWRWWTAAWVHYSALHLLANLAGTALVVAFGIAAGAPSRVAAAWLLAWPLTQLGLLAEPRLHHYAGLSGVLHAGVAAVAVHALLGSPRRLGMQFLGAAVLAALAAKVWFEAPWAEPLQWRHGWDIAIAPAAHASGLVSGILAGSVCELVSRRSANRRDAQRRMRATSEVVE